MGVSPPRVTGKGDSGNAVALQADGKIVVAAEVGYNLANGNEKMAVLRYLGLMTTQCNGDRVTVIAGQTRVASRHDPYAGGVRTLVAAGCLIASPGSCGQLTGSANL